MLRVLVGWLALITSPVIAQTIRLSAAEVGPNAMISFVIDGTGQKVGAESSLSMASTSPVSAGPNTKLDVGLAKPGAFPILFKDLQGRSVESGVLAVVALPSGRLALKWQKVASNNSPGSVLVRFYDKLTSQRLAKTMRQATERYFESNPVELGSTFVFCVVPGMGVSCVLSVGGHAKSIASDALQIAADEMAAEGILSKEEAKAVKTAIEIGSALLAIALDYEALRDPKKLANACQLMVDGGQLVENLTIENKSLKLMVTNFTNLIKRTCVLIGKKEVLVPLPGPAPIP